MERTVKRDRKAAWRIEAMTCSIEPQVGMEPGSLRDILPTC